MPQPKEYTEPSRSWTSARRRGCYRPARVAHWQASAPPPNGWNAPVGIGHQLPIPEGIAVSLIPTDKTDAVTLWDPQPTT
jgi:hypothetical protein